MPFPFNQLNTSDRFSSWRVRLNEVIDWVNNESTNNNYSAAGAPGVNDDSSAGYHVGSIWIDIVSSPREAYRCVDNTNGAAVWLNTTLEIGDLGSIVTQDSDNVNITGGTITGITDLAIADGGTGASTATQARVNLDVYATGSVDAMIDDLSGVSNTAGARTNLDLYSTGEVEALVDDLSGVTNAPTARTNLDVYSKAEVDAIASENAVALSIALG